MTLAIYQFLTALEITGTEPGIRVEEHPLPQAVRTSAVAQINDALREASDYGADRWDPAVVIQASLGYVAGVIEDLLDGAEESEDYEVIAATLRQVLGRLY